MKFIGRQSELKRLRQIHQFTENSGYLTMITGKRRVGKTTLVKHFLRKNKIPHCYFFVSRKQTKAILDEFSKLLSIIFPDMSGMTFTSMDGFFEHIFKKLESNRFTFVFDEFQNFFYVDSSIFSIFQKYWDQYKDIIKGHIIVIGSIQTLMNKIFLDHKEPLYKRLTGRIILNPFSVSEMNEVFHTQQSYDPLKNLSLYLIFNGIPFYYFLMEKEQLFKEDLFTSIDRLLLNKDGLLYDEGIDLLIEEFGRNYSRYFSILEAIASGCTQWNDIANQTGIPLNSIGKYIEELINYYNLIERQSPLFSKTNSKMNRYYIRDNLLTFWFRYIFKNKSILEVGPNKFLNKKIQDDLSNYFGIQFEKYILNWIKEKINIQDPRFQFDIIGKYWDKGQNEIDIATYQNNGDLCLIGECKWNHKRITASTINKLEIKQKIVMNKKKFKQFQKAIFVGDLITKEKRQFLQKNNILVFDAEDYMDVPSGK